MTWNPEDGGTVDDVAVYGIGALGTEDYLRCLADRGLAPKFGQFTVGDAEQLGSGSVAVIAGGSWSATTFAKLPGISVGIAPNVLGPDGEIRVVMSNSNGNMLWSGSENTCQAVDAG